MPIRFTIALNVEGTIQVNPQTYSDKKCSHGHARGAESLANWLHKQIGPPEKGKGKNVGKFKTQRSSEQGIIFFEDCFQRKGENSQRGDHIDLWDRGKTVGFGDPLNHSREVWFWPLNDVKSGELKKRRKKGTIAVGEPAFTSARQGPDGPTHADTVDVGTVLSGG